MVLLPTDPMAATFRHLFCTSQADVESQTERASDEFVAYGAASR